MEPDAACGQCLLAWGGCRVPHASHIVPEGSIVVGGGVGWDDRKKGSERKGNETAARAELGKQAPQFAEQLAG